MFYKEYGSLNNCWQVDVFVGKAPGPLEICMPFTAHDLRYKAEETYPALYVHLSRHAQRFLQSLKYDALELDLVVGHVVEQLVKIGLLGGEDKTPLTALDQLSNAQFYAFLNRSIRNKAIDRLRKRRLQMITTANIEAFDNEADEEDPLNEAIEPLWGPPPFASPEQVALELASQQELRNILRHCIHALSTAPRQLQVVLQELGEFDALDLLRDVVEELKEENALPDIETAVAHASQHKDHAHKKMRKCLQERSSHLAVLIALRLTEYGEHSNSSAKYSVDIQMLAQSDLTEEDVRAGLMQLVAEGLLDWDGNIVVHITLSQMKRLMRFYKDE